MNFNANYQILTSRCQCFELSVSCFNLFSQKKTFSKESLNEIFLIFVTESSVNSQTVNFFKASLGEPRRKNFVQRAFNFEIFFIKNHENSSVFTLRWSLQVFS